MPRRPANLLLTGLVLTLALAAILVFRSLSSASGKAERLLASELKAGREESSRLSRELREELANIQKTGLDSLLLTLNQLGKDQLVLFL